MKNNLLILAIIATLAPSANLLFAMGNPQSAAAQATATQSQSLRVDKAAKDQADAKKKEADKELAIQKVVQAIKNKDLSGVQKYIDEGGDVNARTKGGAQLLTRCVMEGAIKEAQLLLAKNVRVNTKGWCGGALHAAITFHRQDFIDLFLEQGADIEMWSHGYTPLMAAIRVFYSGAVYDKKERAEHYKIIERLLERGANVNALQPFDLTPLATVVSHHEKQNSPDLDCGIRRRRDLIKLLLRWGANYASVARTVNNSLYERTEYLKRKLIEENSRVTTEERAIEELRDYLRSWKDVPALWNSVAITEVLNCLAVHHNEKAKTDLESVIASFIIEERTSEDVAYASRELSVAIRDGDSREIKDLLGSISELHREKDVLGYTRLLALVYKGEAKAVEAFCQAGADIDVQTHDGQTASMIADQQLKAAKDEATIKTYKAIKDTLNHHRAKREEERLAEIKTDEEQAKKEEADGLIEFDRLKRAVTDGDANALSNCSESMLDKNGPALLLHAAKLGYAPIVEKLLEQKVPVDKRDDEYHTALMIAAINGNIETVAVLLKHMAPEHIKMTLHGKTAYELAQEAAAKPGYEQRLEKYKQIMAMLDLYNNAAASAKK